LVKGAQLRMEAFRLHFSFWHFSLALGTCEARRLSRSKLMYYKATKGWAFELGVLSCPGLSWAVLVLG